MNSTNMKVAGRHIVWMYSTNKKLRRYVERMVPESSIDFNQGVSPMLLHFLATFGKSPDIADLKQHLGESFDRFIASHHDDITPAAMRSAIHQRISNVLPPSSAAFTIIYGTAASESCSTQAHKVVSMLRHALEGTPAFIVMWHPNAVEDPALRIAAFEAGANMVSSG